MIEEEKENEKENEEQIVQRSSNRKERQREVLGGILTWGPVGFRSLCHRVGLPSLERLPPCTQDTSGCLAWSQATGVNMASYKREQEPELF